MSKPETPVYSLPKRVAAEAQEEGVALVEFMDDRLDQLPEDAMRAGLLVLFVLGALTHPFLTIGGVITAKFGTHKLRQRFEKSREQRLQKLLALREQARVVSEQRQERRARKREAKGAQTAEALTTPLPS